MSLTTGKTVELLFTKTKESYEHQTQMLPLVSFEQPEGGQMQNAGNVVWRPVQQHAPVIDGWDLTGQETGIIEETYPALLGTPKNDFIQQRADDLRTEQFWERRAKQSGERQATELNKQIASTIATQGSLFIRSNATSGYDVVGEAQALMNERQGYGMERNFLFNDRDNLKYAKDLASRENLVGRPEETWQKGLIGMDVAGFNIYTGSYLPNLAGGASPDATVTGNQSFAPEAGSVNTATGVVTNVDCRIAEIPVSASASYNVGDFVTIGDVQSVGLADKTATGQLMTFTIVGKPDATTIQVYPKPIAADDSALSTLEKAYANVNTTITNADVVARLNTDASAKTNLFWDKGAIEVLGGTIPAGLFKEFDGMNHITDTMSNGQTLYMVYDGNIETMNFRYRIFTWYGITMACPQAAGVLVTY